MRFDIKLEQKVLHGEGDNTLVTYKRLLVTREDFISEYEKDDTDLYNTLREMIYMYHYANGYITQLTDFTMQQMYETLIQNPSYKGICYYIEESECLSNENEFVRSRMVRIDLGYME